jgi:hypothetical protein
VNVDDLDVAEWVRSAEWVTRFPLDGEGEPGVSSGWASPTNSRELARAQGGVTLGPKQGELAWWVVSYNLA